MSVHYRNECKHGKVVSQCRCADPSKTVKIVECPWDCPQKGEVVSFADLMKGPDYPFSYFDPDHKLRQIGWIIGGGPRDGEFLPYNPDWRLPEQTGPHPRITERHGSFSPVYMEIGD